MGDIGDSFSEHKQHRKDVESAQRMNLTLPEFYRWQERVRKEERQQKKLEKLRQCTIQCECGKYLVDKNAWITHKIRFGSDWRNGHKMQPIEHPTNKEGEHEN